MSKSLSIKGYNIHRKLYSKQLEIIDYCIKENVNLPPNTINFVKKYLLQSEDRPILELRDILNKLILSESEPIDIKTIEIDSCNHIIRLSDIPHGVQEIQVMVDW